MDLSNLVVMSIPVQVVPPVRCNDTVNPEKRYHHSGE